MLDDSNTLSSNGQLLLDGLQNLGIGAGDVVNGAALSGLWAGSGSAGTVELIAAVDELSEAGLVDGLPKANGLRLTPAGYARIYG